MDLPSHHAILIEGNVEETLAAIHRSADTLLLNYESLGIDEARSIIEASLTAPVIEEKKRIIISFRDITREAQNALLKILEDPSPQVEFLIITENASALLPTLRSRLYVMGSKSSYAEAASAGREAVQIFVKMPVADRLKEVEKMVKAQKDSGSKALIRSFLLSLHDELKVDEGSRTTFKTIHNALLYLDDKGASTKVLLESVALAL